MTINTQEQKSSQTSQNEIKKKNKESSGGV